jgi:hypothetical protein
MDHELDRDEINILLEECRNVEDFMSLYEEETGLEPDEADILLDI